MGMTVITTDDVKHVAKLANIAITHDEAIKFTKELAIILGYVQQLNAVDTDGLQPTYQVTGLTSVMRKDVVINYGTTRQGLLQNAALSRDGYIEVPKVL